MFRLDDPETGDSIIVANDGTFAYCTPDAILFEGWSLDRIKNLANMIDKAKSAHSYMEDRAAR